METPYFGATDTAVLPSSIPIPGLGVLPCNAYVIMAEEPVLVDTGMGMDSEEFIKALASVIDPDELRWIVITHDDSDHVGSVVKVLEAAPNARIASNAVAVLRLGTSVPIPMDRVFLLNPGESISAGDRNLTAFRPPIFDNPATLGFYDDKTGSVYSADLFGAVLPTPVRDVDEVPDDVLSRSMVLWGTVDAPWIHFVDRGEFHHRLDAVRQMAPEAIYSSHLPPAQGRTEQFLSLLETVPDAQPFLPPNQAQMQAMMGAV
jgi:flavorubredoxin